VAAASRLRLWTVQHRDAWAQLQATGVLRTDPAFTEPDWAPAYRWMVDAMHRHPGPPPPGVTLPVWAHVRHRWKARWRPLRRELWLRSGATDPESVFVEISVPRDRVLLSSFDLWEQGPLMRWFTHEESEWEDLARSLGGSADDPAGAWTETPGAQAVMRASWARCLDPARFGCCVQATLWEIHASDVRRWRYCRHLPLTRPGPSPGDLPPASRARIQSSSSSGLPEGKPRRG
jgi:hypothetical protein